MNTWDILKIFLILGAMVGIMYATLYFVKKYFYTFNNKETNSKRVNILSTQTILPKKYVSVIKFNNTIYLLGVAEQSINLLDKYEETDEIEEDNTSESPEKRQNFLQLLKQNMGIK